MTTPIYNQTENDRGVTKMLDNSISSESLSKTSVKSTSYVLIVLEMMQTIGLGPIESLMQTEAQMMDVTAKIQSDLTTIQSFLSKIENLAHSGAAWKVNPKIQNMAHSGMYDPNAYNALYKEFKENPNAMDIPNSDNDTVAPDFKTSVQNFLSAFKDLFTGQSCDPGDASAQSNFTTFTVNKMAEGQNLQESFSLKDLFGPASNPHSLNSNPQGWGMVSKLGSNEATFGTSSTTKASLIQQYTYYQYQMAAEKSKAYVPGADISKLPFSMDPNSGNFDGVGRSLLGLLNSFNTTITVNRENDTNNPNAGRLSNKSTNFLMYLLEKDPTKYRDASDKFDGGYAVNIYGALSFAAFNYFWTQNPNASVDKGSSPELSPGSINGQSYSAADDKGVAAGDKLSIWYSDSQSSSSLVSSGSSESSTTMQEYTSEVSQYQNIGQNIVKTNSDSNLAIVNNFKTG